MASRCYALKYPSNRNGMAIPDHRHLGKRLLAGREKVHEVAYQRYRIEKGDRGTAKTGEILHNTLREVRTVVTVMFVDIFISESPVGCLPAIRRGRDGDVNDTSRTNE